MHKHPNQSDFTAPCPETGNHRCGGPAESRESSSGEKSHENSQKLHERIDGLCIDGLCAAVDAARSALSQMLFGPDQSWEATVRIDRATKCYIDAATTCRKAQAELYDRQQAALSSARLRRALQEARAKGILSAPVSAYVDLFAPPPPLPIDLKGSETYNSETCKSEIHNEGNCVN